MKNHSVTKRSMCGTILFILILCESEIDVLCGTHDTDKPAECAILFDFSDCPKSIWQNPLGVATQNSEPSKMRFNKKIMRFNSKTVHSLT